MPYRLSQALEGPQDQDQGRAHGDAGQESAMEGDAVGLGDFALESSHDRFFAGMESGEGAVKVRVLA